MDYGSRWSEPWAPPSNAAPYGGGGGGGGEGGGAPATHHLTSIQQPSQNQPTLPYSSYLSSYYPTTANPSAPDTTANPSAALQGPDPYLKNPYPSRGGYESLYPSVPPATDTYLPKPYAPRGGYDGFAAPAKESAAAPPMADPYAPKPYVPHGGYEGLHSSAATARHSYLPHGPSAASSNSYYGGERVHSLAVKEAIRQYGEDPNSYKKLEEDPSRYGAQAGFSNWQQSTLSSHQRPAFSNKATHPVSTHVKSMAPEEARRKRLKVTNKVMRSAFCDVCKIDCSTAEVLNSHKQGKKHKKNLLKLQEAITAKPAKAPSITLEKETPADEDKNVSEVRKKRLLPATEEELEIKKKRVLEGGAAADGIKVCNICNVVVNSQKVFDYHIAGQKHAEMLKKAEAAAS